MNLATFASDRAWDLVDLGRRYAPIGFKRAFRTVFPRSMSSAFSEIYRRDIWEGGSGRGSTPENTERYRAFLQTFLEEHPEVKTVVDLGCGDWQFSKLIDWSSVRYVGIDTVPDVVEANRLKYGYRAHFECLDISQRDLPEGDLVIIKDVLQHWPTDAVTAFLPRLRQYKYAIITNCAYGPSLNTDIAVTGYRPLDLRAAPFNLEAAEALRYRTDEVDEDVLNKLTLLVHTERL